MGEFPTLKNSEWKTWTRSQPQFPRGHWNWPATESRPKFGGITPPLCTSLPIFVDSWVCQGGYEAHEAPWAGHPCWMYSGYSAYWHRVWLTLLSLAGQRCCHSSYHLRSGPDSPIRWSHVLKKQEAKSVTWRECLVSSDIIHWGESCFAIQFWES